MNTQPHPPGESGLNTGRFAGATTKTEILSTRQECRHKCIHHAAANAATKHLKQDVHLKIVCKTGRRKIKKHHAVECEYVKLQAIGEQLNI
jgi:hypothetical protein